MDQITCLSRLQISEVTGQLAGVFLRRESSSQNGLYSGGLVAIGSLSSGVCVKEGSVNEASLD